MTLGNSQSCPKERRQLAVSGVRKEAGISKRRYGALQGQMVAKGYAQREGIDYNEVFSHVVKHSSIRILLALVAQYCNIPRGGVNR